MWLVIHDDDHDEELTTTYLQLSSILNKLLRKEEGQLPRFDEFVFSAVLCISSVERTKERR